MIAHVLAAVPGLVRIQVQDCLRHGTDRERYWIKTGTCDSAPIYTLTSVGAALCSDVSEDEKYGSDDEFGYDDDGVVKQQHQGYSSSIEPPGTTVGKGARVAVYFAAPHDGWFEGRVLSTSSKGTNVRFEDGEYTVALPRDQYGRFKTWVLPDDRDETWAEDGHVLIGKPCVMDGRRGEVCMVCEARGSFVVCFDDWSDECELSACEAERAVQLATASPRQKRANTGECNRAASASPRTVAADGRGRRRALPASSTQQAAAVATSTFKVSRMARAIAKLPAAGLSLETLERRGWRIPDGAKHTWQVQGHRLLGTFVVQPCNGVDLTCKILAWLPGKGEDAEMFWCMHPDGDGETLEDDEVRRIWP